MIINLSTLTRWSGEVRNRIYDFYFSRSEGIQIQGTTNKESPLRSLRGELRNRIYELVLNPPEGLHIYAHGQMADMPRTLTPILADARALRRTCKSIYKETEGFEYAVKTFCFHVALYDSASAAHRNERNFDERSLPTYLKNWRSSFMPCFSQFVNQSNAPNIRIVCDQWDAPTLRPAAYCTQTSIVSQLTEIDKCITRAGAHLSIEMNVKYTSITDKNVSPMLGAISFPVGDQAQAMKSIGDACGAKNRELCKTWLKSGTRIAASRLQEDLHQCRCYLERFVKEYYQERQKHRRS